MSMVRIYGTLAGVHVDIEDGKSAHLVLESLNGGSLGSLFNEESGRLYLLEKALVGMKGKLVEITVELVHKDTSDDDDAN